MSFLSKIRTNDPVLNGVATVLHPDGISSINDMLHEGGSGDYAQSLEHAPSSTAWGEAVNTRYLVDPTGWNS